MSDAILTAIESAKADLIKRAGRTLGATLAPAEAVFALHGDSEMALAYAALFFPVLRLVDGTPWARFATDTTDSPIDCVHANLLHHTSAAGGEPGTQAAFAQVLAQAWNHALHRQQLPGHFRYDASVGHDVVYVP